MACHANDFVFTHFDIAHLVACCQLKSVHVLVFSNAIDKVSLRRRGSCDEIGAFELVVRKRFDNMASDRHDEQGVCLVADQELVLALWNGHDGLDRRVAEAAHGVELALFNLGLWVDCVQTRCCFGIPNLRISR